MRKLEEDEFNGFRLGALSYLGAAALAAFSFMVSPEDAPALGAFSMGLVAAGGLAIMTDPRADEYEEFSH